MKGAQQALFVCSLMSSTMNNDPATCSICGADHDATTTPELDSTHLCPECVTAQTALHRPLAQPLLAKRAAARARAA